MRHRKRNWLGLYLGVPDRHLLRKPEIGRRIAKFDSRVRDRDEMPKRSSQPLTLGRRLFCGLWSCEPGSRRCGGGVVRGVSSWILLGSRRFAKHSPTGDASQDGEDGRGSTAGDEGLAWVG